MWAQPTESPITPIEMVPLHLGVLRIARGGYCDLVTCLCCDHLTKKWDVALDFEPRPLGLPYCPSNISGGGGISISG